MMRAELPAEPGAARRRRRPPRPVPDAGRDPVHRPDLPDGLGRHAEDLPGPARRHHRHQRAGRGHAGLDRVRRLGDRSGRPAGCSPTATTSAPSTRSATACNAALAARRGDLQPGAGRRPGPRHDGADRVPADRELPARALYPGALAGHRLRAEVRAGARPERARRAADRGDRRRHRLGRRRAARDGGLQRGGGERRADPAARRAARPSAPAIQPAE